jgi:hypothetical protein
MLEPGLSTSAPCRCDRLAQLRIWHLGLLVAYVAIAIVDIQDYCRGEPFLVALASAGFAGYAVLVWLIWRMVRRLEARLGLLALVILYLIGMAVLYLVATLVYLTIEDAYRAGRLGMASLGWARGGY